MLAIVNVAAIVVFEPTSPWYTGRDLCNWYMVKNSSRYSFSLPEIVVHPHSHKEHYESWTVCISKRMFF